MNQEQSLSLAALADPQPAVTPFARARTAAATLSGNTFLRKGLLLFLMAAAWHLYARHLGNELLLPAPLATLAAFSEGLATGEIPRRTLASLKILLVGYGGGVALAFLLATLATCSRLWAQLLELLTAMFNPLPAIALLPLALIWFGLGAPSIVFVLVHAVVWPIALTTHAGFCGVSRTLRMVGRNYGLAGPALVARILIPAAFPSILAGLKNGWAFAWRTLIAAELVFGVSSGSGGLGWFIYEKKNELETAQVFAGLGTVIVIGLLLENLVFGTVERLTIRKWGMTS